MQIDEALKKQIAAAIHATVVIIDPHEAGLWRCEIYAGIGARLLQVVTGDNFEPVGGITGILPANVCPRPVELLHASGNPLNTAPSWADLSWKARDPGHAWVEDRSTGELVDFSVKPVLWGYRSPAGDIAGHVYNLVESDTMTLQEKYSRLSIVDDFARLALATAAPAVFRQANGTTANLLGRIAAIWPREAEKYLLAYNAGRFW